MYASRSARRRFLALSERTTFREEAYQLFGQKAARAGLVGTA